MKKNGLFKILIILMAVMLLLTWFIPAGYYSSEYVEAGIYRLGFFDFWQYLILPFFQSVFIEVLIFILSVGAFYGVLVKTGAYRKVTEKIAKNFKKKGTLALILIAFIFAALSSFGGYGLLMFIFIPMVVSIILLMGYDKLTAFLSTFGAMLIGVIGSTYGYNSIGQIITALNLSYSANLYFKVSLFVLSFIVFILFTLKYAEKVKESKAKKDVKDAHDMYLGEEITRKSKVWPIYTVFGILFVLMILGCTRWNDVFGIELFTKLNTAITTFAIKIKETEYTIFSYILGSATYEFGEWSYFQLSIMLVISSFIVGKIYKFKFNETLNNMIDGLSKVIKESLLITFAYGILIISANTGIFTTLMSYLLENAKSFNLFGTSGIMIFGSALHIELPYLGQIVMPYLAGLYTNEIGTSLMNVMSQSLYGTTMLIAPTSLFLILGLSYLDIPYKKWLKFIWKLVLELLILIIVVLITMMLVIK